ncbi:DUF1573 domain-containing protein [Algoriphagus sp. CAU 1675]|uniref:DUF1573 domain-containing protein n=1 Tax=Algoriphagus sp. CAU 1675 TaxID=3032597 RepID=UPI0023DC3549|nr:DUF1573 domain-containing protein [Algoriphagus sp. CAU 1675]MDF2157721.1 DUF1573 domain-containing protein [Algoriphagus sp. CAU 1675]
MIFLKNLTLILAIALSLTQLSHAQETVTPKIIWEVNKIELGTILEEMGTQVVEFRFTHTQDSLFYIEKVWTDCGCTTVEYTQDTLEVGGKGRLQVSFDPATAAGNFSRLVVVKGNLFETQDTLYLEGTVIPYPQNPEREYPFRQGDIGLRLQKVNMGDVFTNEPKVKDFEIFNFSDQVLHADSLTKFGPEYIQVRQIQQMIPSNDRGLIQLIYSGAEKDDLGFFEDPMAISWSDSITLQLDVVANVFQYFPPFSKEELGAVPNLALSTKEIDLKEISANSIQHEVVTLTNKGRQVLEILKIQGNCSCLKLELPTTSVNPGESIELKITFDPKGRKGIDQRNIYIFSNDPLNPVQGLVIKSRIK